MTIFCNGFVRNARLARKKSAMPVNWQSRGSLKLNSKIDIDLFCAAKFGTKLLESPVPLSEPFGEIATNQVREEIESL